MIRILKELGFTKNLRFSIWCDETVENILKNDFYISKEISDSQVQTLVEKSLSIYENRKLFDLELKKLKSVMYGELLNQGATQKQRFENSNF